VSGEHGRRALELALEVRLVRERSSARRHEARHSMVDPAGNTGAQDEIDAAVARARLRALRAGAEGEALTGDAGRLYRPPMRSASLGPMRCTSRSSGGIGAGDEVIVPSFTFFRDAEAVFLHRRRRSCRHDIGTFNLES